jgi:hypothetical protein
MMALPGGQREETPKLSRPLAFPANPMYKGGWALVFFGNLPL